MSKTCEHMFKEGFKVSSLFALDLDVLFVLDISLIWQIAWFDVFHYENLIRNFNIFPLLIGVCKNQCFFF